MLTARHALETRDAVLADADSGSFHCLDLSPVGHREAERLLLHIESATLRTLDALHVAVALPGSATHVVTCDACMHAAALRAGLGTLELQARAWIWQDRRRADAGPSYTVAKPGFAIIGSRCAIHRATLSVGIGMSCIALGSHPITEIQSTAPSKTQADAA